MMNRKAMQFSPLELLYPTGYIENGLAIGSNVPEQLNPEKNVTSDSPVELLLFAPTGEECRKKGWLKDATKKVQKCLAPNGLAYVLVPVRWRLIVYRLFKNVNLQPNQYLLHLPSWHNSRYIFPLQIFAAKYVLSSIIPTNRIRRLLALGILQIPGGKNILGLLLPTGGMIFGHEKGDCRLTWLSALDPSLQDCVTASISTSWQTEQISIVLHCFSGGELPRAVVKTIEKAETSTYLNREVDNIQQLGECAKSSGIKIPKIINCYQVGGRQVILESTVPGKSAAVLLSESPSQVQWVMERVVDWLINWNKATKSIKLSTDELLEREVNTLLEHIKSDIDDVAEYTSWIKNLATKIGTPIPTVAVHQDLTMWNILVDKQGQLGIVDWNEANSTGLPFVDFYYAFVDAVANAHRINHEHAFMECFINQGIYRKLAHKLLKHLYESIQIQGATIDLCLHACFVHHAFNEQQSWGANPAREFKRILLYLMRNRVTLGL